MASERSKRHLDALGGGVARGVENGVPENGALQLGPRHGRHAGAEVEPDVDFVQATEAAVLPDDDTLGRHAGVSCGWWWQGSL